MKLFQTPSEVITEALSQNNYGIAAKALDKVRSNGRYSAEYRAMAYRPVCDAFTQALRSNKPFHAITIYDHLAYAVRDLGDEAKQYAKNLAHPGAVSTSLETLHDNLSVLNTHPLLRRDIQTAFGAVLRPDPATLHSRHADCGRTLAFILHPSKRPLYDSHITEGLMDAAGIVLGSGITRQPEPSEDARVQAHVIALHLQKREDDIPLYRAFTTALKHNGVASPLISSPPSLRTVYAISHLANAGGPSG